MVTTTPPVQSKRPSYVAYVHAALPQRGAEPDLDGERLALECQARLAALEDAEQFPPRLLTLLLSPAYGKADAQRLLSALRRSFPDGDKVPLIGCMVGGVIFDRRVHPEGALLTCLASRLVNVRVAAGRDGRSNPHLAVDALLRELLKVQGDQFPDLNPMGNRWLLSFVPGYRWRGAAETYKGPEIHAAMLESTMGRFPIVGGVSSVGDRPDGEDSLQFVHGDVLTGAVVGALVESGAATATSVGHGFRELATSLRVAELSPDGRQIIRFADLDMTAAQVLEELGKPLLLGQMSADDRLVTIVPTAQPNGHVQVHRRVRFNDTFVVLKPDRQMMTGACRDAVRHALRRSQVESVTGALIIFCMGLYRHRRTVEVEVEELLTEIPALIQHAPCVGGLFDGEIALDHAGKSIFTNWSIAPVVFADEIRQRTLTLRGFESQAKYGPKLLNAQTLEELARDCLGLVCDTGYPGAMISVLFHDAPETQWIIAVEARGAKFKRILGQTRRKLESDDLLAVIAKKGDPLFSPNLAHEESADQAAVSASGLISHYVMPLKKEGKETFALLQVDMGDVSYRKELSKAEKDVLRALGDEIAAALSRFIGEEELRIARQVDQALLEGLEASSVGEAVQGFLVKAVHALGCARGHVRLAVEKNELEIVAGVGPYFELAGRQRLRILATDSSPTAEAFLHKRVIVRNDACHHQRRMTLAARHPEGSPFVKAVEADAATASVPLFIAGELYGAMTICADHSWFFNQSKYNSLRDLGWRLSFLIRHIRTKRKSDAEQKASRKSRRRLKFLNDVGLDLAKATSCANPAEALKAAIGRLRAAFMAEVGGLYLLDVETRTLILRGESNWVEGEWLNAARYQVGEGWTGRVFQLDLPEYVPDMREYKRAQNVDAPSKYAKEMFGGPLLEPNTVEAIGLPLRVGKKVLGVAVLYRRRPALLEAGSTAFCTKNPGDLKAAMENMAALVHALVAAEEARSREEETERRRAVLSTLTGPPQAGFANFIASLLAGYRAKRADLYLPDPRDPTCQLVWAGGGSRHGKEIAIDENTPGAADDLVVAARRCELKVEQHRLTQEQAMIAARAKTLGLVERACIPLEVPGANWVGVLDIRWSIHRTGVSPRLVHHFPDLLAMLGRQVAGALRQQQLLLEKEISQQEAECSDLTVKAMSAVIVQSIHRLMNTLRSIRLLEPRMKLASTEAAEWTDLFDDFKRLTEEGLSYTERLREISEGIQQLKRVDVSVASLLGQAVDKFAPTGGGGERIELFGYHDLQQVCVDPDLVAEAFFNVIHNAVKACKETAHARLKITVNGQPEARTVKLSFEDNAGGMSAESLKAVRKGFFKSEKGGLGVGVLLASVLISSSGGRFDIQSELGCGTIVTIHLPVG